MESEVVSYEELILKRIEEAGDEGVTQADLIRDLKIPAEEVTRILSKLVRKKKVIKKSVRDDNKNVIKYFIAKSGGPSLFVDLDLVSNIPCFTCRNLNKCGDGMVISPTTCQIMTNFVLSVDLNSLLRLQSHG